MVQDKEALADPEAHLKNADLFHCLAGKADFIVGGALVNPWFKTMPDGFENKNEPRAKEIKGGENITLEQGDWLWVPAGCPHQHGSKSVTTLLVVKIPTAH